MLMRERKRVEDLLINYKIEKASFQADLVFLETTSYRLFITEESISKQSYFLPYLGQTHSMILRASTVVFNYHRKSRKVTKRYEVSFEKKKAKEGKKKQIFAVFSRAGIRVSCLMNVLGTFNVILLIYIFFAENFLSVDNF